MDTITQAMSNDELLCHYLAMNNTCADGEFDDSNMFE